MSEKGGIYVHIPVCRRKCLYCSFYSVGERKIKDWRSVTEAILREFDSRIHEMQQWEESTIYIGGGTPSLLPVEEFRYMFTSLISKIREFNPRIKLTEITIEVNPDDVTAAKAECWKKAGVNRVSMGVQSLVDGELKSIGRRHDSATALKAYDILSQYFDNISLDLIFGLPGQTVESLNATLNGFMTLAPAHISAYSLMFEERSALTRLRDAGKIEETDEDITVSMFGMINDVLSKHGYQRYEISNYAQPDHEAIHNRSYWNGLPYIGLGPSAHSYDGLNKRRWNVEDLDRYIVGVENGSDYYEEESLSPAELLEEKIMTGLRTSEGIEFNTILNSFGVEALNELKRKARKATAEGYLRMMDNAIVLTEKGVMVADEIIVQLF